MMDPWFLQQSFPVISVRVVQESQDGRTFELSQSPVNLIDSLPESQFNYTWPVPIHFKTDLEETRFLWMAPGAWKGKVDLGRGLLYACVL